MDIITETITYIENHLHKKLIIEEIASALHYSKYYLHRLFSQAAGMTIHSYVQRRKLTEAAKQLVYTQLPIIEIAYCAGYETQQAFSAVFKAMYKMPPLQFRKCGKYYPLQLAFCFDLNQDWYRYCHRNLRIGVRLAEMEDILIWMDLVYLAVDGYPCLNTEEYVQALKGYIARRQAFILDDTGNPAGIMLLDYEAAHIDFIGIHPFYKQYGLDSIMLETAKKKFESSRAVSITTYREGDKADTGYRKALINLGFREAELLMEFDYPTQKFIYTF